jgi:D-3-phosphoglycerate dehydrogenase
MFDRRFRVVVTGPNLASDALARLTGFDATLEFMRERIEEEDLVTILRGRRTDAIILRGNPPLTRRVLKAAEGLRVVAKHGTGVDTIDIDSATELGIIVVIAGGANADAVAEMTIALICALGRDIVRLNARLQQGHWDRETYIGSELRGRTIGIVGYGQIGRRVALLARGLGLQVVAWSRRVSSIDPSVASPIENLEKLLSDSDIVSLHCPANRETRHLLNGERLALMKPGALLINTARGSLIDEVALADLLAAGKLGGAALDTLSEEPPSADHPLLLAPNLILTPHVAAFTQSALERTALMAVENMIAVLTGKPVDLANVVNPETLAGHSQ